ncbi:proteoglycan 3 [Perognathus longimembris pacificus]|uniref:proteoglycan 3 n=1 Tax=Perognathus longimembris pacificus TaxID=214514 RepID=UPI00201907CA|nr:proteoglycan 3 [Perognathus longimembris pacificus]
MKGLLLLPLFLGTISSLHLENDADPHLKSIMAGADLDQGLDGVEEQERELAPAQEVTQAQGDEAQASRHQDAFEEEEEEEAMELNPDALDKDLLCPREEDTVHMEGSPGCKTCHYRLVRTPKTFTKAQSVCQRCYKGNLVSIHSSQDNYQVQCAASQVNQAQIWIGGFLKGWFLWKKFRWTDGSCWDFEHWAPRQPRHGRGHCVTLCTKGGHWQRAPCRKHLPFVCSY